MTAAPPARPVARVLAGALLAATAVAIACSAPTADRVAAPEEAAAPEVPATLAEAQAMPAPTPDGDQPYFEHQTDVPVTAAPGGAAPRFPEELRAAGVEGSVLAQFVVGRDGRPEMETLRIISADHPGFAEAVRTALPRMRFTAAQAEGRAVRQVVQQPFVFRID